MKTCSRCKTDKPTTEFSKNKRAADGLCAACKVCTRAASAVYYAANPDKRRATESNWRRKNKQKKWKQHLSYAYGMTLEEYQQRLTDQNNCCAICTRQFEGRGATRTGPCVDHCHVTGKVRKIICTRCNQLLGAVNDSIEILAAAVNYLKDHQG